MQILNKKEYSDKELYKKLCAILADGGLLVLPSDTVYGLVCDATNEKAIQKLIQMKSRPTGKPISVFVGSMEMAEKHVEISRAQEKIMKEMLPGPYTIVLPSKHKVSKEIESEIGTLGIRIPEYECVNTLVQMYGMPLTATSANIAGKGPHSSIDALLNTLSAKRKGLIDAIVDAGTLPKKRPSTVVDFSGSDIEVLREGSGEIHMQGSAGSAQDFSLITHSEKETQHFAQNIVKKHKDILKEKPLVIMLYGDVGVGKTVFVKGIGELVGIDDIISPTFVIYYEYDIEKDSVSKEMNDTNIKRLYHFDLYRIQEKAEYKHLGIEDVLKPGNLICIEWSERSDAIKKLIYKKAHVIELHFTHLNEKERGIKNISTNS